MSGFINWLQDHLLSCPYKSLTGFDCPGCGIQRSFIALLRGNVAESLHLYPALLPVIFTLVFTALHLKFNFKHGAAVIKYSFIATMAIMMVSYTIKMTM